VFQHLLGACLPAKEASLAHQSGNIHPLSRPLQGKPQAFIICSMNETPRIPSPIPYLMQVPDLRAHNTTYDWRMLFMPVLMALGSGRTNVLAIAQWVEDQRDWLLALGFGRRKTATALPAQATIYRFMWALEQQVVALQL